MDSIVLIMLAWTLGRFSIELEKRCIRIGCDHIVISAIILGLQFNCVLLWLHAFVRFHNTL